MKMTKWLFVVLLVYTSGVSFSQEAFPDKFSTETEYLAFIDSVYELHDLFPVDTSFVSDELNIEDDYEWIHFFDVDKNGLNDLVFTVIEDLSYAVQGVVFSMGDSIVPTLIPQCKGSEFYVKQHIVVSEKLKNSLLIYYEGDSEIRKDTIYYYNNFWLDNLPQQTINSFTIKIKYATGTDFILEGDNSMLNYKIYGNEGYFKEGNVDKKLYRDLSILLAALPDSIDQPSIVDAPGKVEINFKKEDIEKEYISTYYGSSSFTYTFFTETIYKIMKSITE